MVDTYAQGRSECLRPFAVAKAGSAVKKCVASKSLAYRTGRGLNVVKECLL